MVVTNKKLRIVNRPSDLTPGPDLNTETGTAAAETRGGNRPRRKRRRRPLRRAREVRVGDCSSIQKAIRFLRDATYHPLLLAGRMPPQRHSTVEVGWPGGGG